MTRLLEAVKTLGLEAEASRSGRWVRFPGALGTAYVLETLWGSDYYVWCDPLSEQGTALYRDPLEAIRAGLRLSSGKDNAVQ